jgi:hypothetical protein
VVVLLSESASLTARETLTVLGSGGIRADVLTVGGLPIGRFSRWRRRLIAAPPPGADPFAYLSLVSALCSAGEYEAVLATHEQAWLFAAGRHLLPADAPVAVSLIEAFDRVSGKVEFAELCDVLGIPQPRWWRCDQRPARVPYPHWVKASYGTAGRAVRKVDTAEQEHQAVRELSGTSGPVMGQAPAAGQYGQVQVLFEHGRLVAAHTSVAIGAGGGGSAAARLSVDHPAAREYATRVGTHLRWHGGLTLDYFHVDGQPQFIECNPRTVEPGNAARAGVDFPRLTIALSQGGPLPDRPVIGRAGIRTRSALALAIGAAERYRSRAAVLGVLRDCAVQRGEAGRAAEVLTPVVQDPPSAAPLTAATLLMLAIPSKAATLADGAVRSYSISPATIALVRAATPGQVAGARAEPS